MIRAALRWMWASRGGFVRALACWLWLASSVTFACFIFEEACQTAGFAVRNYALAKDPAGVTRAVDTFESCRAAGSWTARNLGWLNPISYESFVVYFDSACVSYEASARADPNAPVTVTATPSRETAKAWQINGRWVPKSQVTRAGDTFTGPGWAFK